MKNDIYDLLNDIDNQIDTFENIDITSTDLKNWKQSFTSKKKASLKKHTWKKYGKTERIRTITADYGEVIHTFRC